MPPPGVRQVTLLVVGGGGGGGGSAGAGAGGAGHGTNGTLRNGAAGGPGGGGGGGDGNSENGAGGVTTGQNSGGVGNGRNAQAQRSGGIDGHLIFNRDDPAIPDGPFEDMIIAFVPVDDDGVTLDVSVLDAEILEDTPLYKELAREDFRYGRLLVDNAYGPETEDLAITFRVEYYDSESGRFVPNTDDSCTVINASQLTLLEGTETGELQPEETSIVAPQSSTFHNGQIQGVQAALNPTDDTFTATAPGLDNHGTIDVELDLGQDGLNLPFLQFKWPHEDNDYDENPRATLEFGQYRSHDRVISWKEIFNGASQ